MNRSSIMVTEEQAIKLLCPMMLSAPEEITDYLCQGSRCMAFIQEEDYHDSDNNQYIKQFRCGLLQK